MHEFFLFFLSSNNNTDKKEAYNLASEFIWAQDVERQDCFNKFQPTKKYKGLTNKSVETKETIPKEESQQIDLNQMTWNEREKSLLG